MRAWWLAVGLCLAGPARATAQVAEPVQAFLSTYCFECHGPDRQKSGVRFDDAEAEGRVSLLELAAELVEEGHMPPEDAPLHPDVEPRALHALSLAEAPTPRPPLRRLTGTELLNTARDVFGIRGLELPPSMPSEPDDLAVDTLADELHISVAQLDANLEFATRIADEVVPLPDGPRIALRSVAATWRLSRMAWRSPGNPKTYAFTGVNLAGRSGAVWDDDLVAPTAGVYTLELRVAADAPSGDDGRPLRLGVFAVNPSRYESPERAPRAGLPLLATIEVPGLELETLTADIELERGETIHVYCLNRLAPSEVPGDANRNELADLVDAAKADPAPTVRIAHMRLAGPVHALPRQIVLGSGGDKPQQIRAALLPLAERLFRRPLTRAESEALIADALEHGRAVGHLAFGLHRSLRRLLCSPQFLFLELGEAPDHDLATRLALFLWRGAPDAELMRHAAAGDLRDPAVLRVQVQRLLDDARSQRFVTALAETWLGTRRMQSLIVCNQRVLWSELLRYGYVRSAELFLSDVLVDDLPVTTFIDSNFTYASAPMRIAWGFPGPHPTWDEMEDRRAQSLTWPEPERLDLADLPPDVPAHVAQRGGVLGLPSVLSGTGDGVESSPILRGVWVLEHLFGTRPPPPPPDVPALLPDTSGALTVAERLSAHTASPSCARCHADIDPLGLALENFDAVGGWRESYASRLAPEGVADRDAGPSTFASDGASIDATAVLPDGERIDGLAGIKRHLLERPELFTACLATKLLETATGRRLEPADRRFIDAIVAAEPEGGYGFRGLIEAAVVSELFLGAP